MACYNVIWYNVIWYGVIYYIVWYIRWCGRAFHYTCSTIWWPCFLDTTKIYFLDLRDLVQGILVHDANGRMTLHEILFHPWLAMVKVPKQVTSYHVSQTPLSLNLPQFYENKMIRDNFNFLLVLMFYLTYSNGVLSAFWTFLFT